MKKIRFNKRSVHFKDIDTDDVIIVKSMKKIVGTIIYHEEIWVGSSNAGDRYNCSDIKTIMNEIFKGCKLYVL